MLHLQQSFEEAESDLAVFGAILFESDGSVSCDASASHDEKVSRRRQVKLSQELDSLRGMLHVIRSVRSSTSSICKTSRFPPADASTSGRMFIASGLLMIFAAQRHAFHFCCRLRHSPGCCRHEGGRRPMLPPAQRAAEAVGHGGSGAQCGCILRLATQSLSRPKQTTATQRCIAVPLP
jgi:hypothetical protein